MPDKATSNAILYLSYDGLTDTLGQSQILPYLTGLADEGYTLTIISFEKTKRFAKYRTAVETICRDHNILWKPLRYHKFPVILSTVYDLFVLRSTIRPILRERSIAIVHCRSYLTSLVGLWAKQKFHVKFIFDMRGFWADERVEGGLWKLANPVFRMIYHFFKRKEKQFIREADHVVSLTENAKSEIRSWGIAQTPVSVIPTCVDMELFNPETAATAAESLKKTLPISPEDFVLVYLGSWGTWYLTNEILEFFSALASLEPRSRLLILTPDTPDIANYPFASRTIIRNVSRKDVPAFLALAHASVCFIKPSFSKKASSATKIAEAWAMNLPVVTNRGWGDIERLNAQGMPLLLCDTKSEYERIIATLFRREVKTAREMLIGKFDLRSGVKSYGSIYRSLGTP